MKQVYKINGEGIYVEPMIVSSDEPVPNGCVVEAPPDGLFQAKWINGSWKENLSQGEIDAIKNQIQPKTEFELLRDDNKRLQQQLASTNENLEGLMNYLAETGVL